jgi:hypothetical protein
MTRDIRIWIKLGALALAAAAAPAMAGESLKRALSEGDPEVDVRYRYEAVEEGGVPRNASASTVRLRLGYRTDKFHDFFGLVDFEAIRTVGAENYNSTANDKTRYPVVIDPEDEEVNRAYLGYSRNPNRTFKLGRQRITLDNHRFIGNVGWRQNEQTFDAFSYKGKETKRIKTFYARLNNANRIHGEHHPVPALADIALTADLFNVSHKCSAGTSVVYAYLLEFDDMPAASHKNLGFRFTGEAEIRSDLDLLYTAEFADQSDYERGAPINDAEYYLAELGVRVSGVTVILGYELLGGDGIYGFQTPLATGHKFNGWADKFLATPAGGLRDLYLSAERKVKGFRLLGVYHDFQSDAGSTDYGTELNLLVVKPLGEVFTFGAKFAKYDADMSATNTEKFWTWLQLKI